MSIELRSSYEYRKILIAGGMKPEDAEKFVSFMDKECDKRDMPEIIMDDMILDSAVALSPLWIVHTLAEIAKEGANKQVISSQVDSLIKISRIWADFFPANTSNQPI
ncbi:HEAT repeat domain-containing protein [Escherichia coli]